MILAITKYKVETLATLKVQDLRPLPSLYRDRLNYLHIDFISCGQCVQTWKLQAQAQTPLLLHLYEEMQSLEVDKLEKQPKDNLHSGD